MVDMSVLGAGSNKRPRWLSVTILFNICPQICQYEWVRIHGETTSSSTFLIYILREKICSGKRDLISIWILLSWSQISQINFIKVTLGFRFIPHMPSKSNRTTHSKYSAHPTPKTKNVTPRLIARDKGHRSDQQVSKKCPQKCPSSMWHPLLDDYFILPFPKDNTTFELLP